MQLHQKRPFLKNEKGVFKHHNLLKQNTNLFDELNNKIRECYQDKKRNFY
jgi:hypothetical protein